MPTRLPGAPVLSVSTREPRLAMQLPQPRQIRVSSAQKIRQQRVIFRPPDVEWTDDSEAGEALRIRSRQTGDNSMPEVTPDELVRRVERIVEWSRHLTSAERATLRAAARELRDHRRPVIDAPEGDRG